MKLFDLEKNKVVINPAALLIHEFKEVYERDKEPNKSRALKEFGYIYYMGDYKSIYLSVPPDERESVIIEDVFKKEKWTPDVTVKAAVDKYIELQKTPTMRLIKSAFNVLEETINYFNSVDYTERDNRGQPIYKVNDVTKAVSDLGKVTDSLEKLDEKVKKELKETAKARGGAESALFEDFDFR